MNKRTFLVAVLAAVAALTSCIRDEDIEMLKHPIHIQGEIDPHYGLPVAYGEADVNDLLHMLSSEYTGYLDPDRNTLTVVFDTTGSDVIYASGTGSAAAATRKAGPASKAIWRSFDTTLTYSLPITLFDDVANNTIDPDSLQIGHFWLKVGMFMQGHARTASFEQTIRQVVSARFDSLRVHYTAHDGSQHLAEGITNPAPVTIDSLLNGMSFAFDSVDLGPIINDMPRMLTVSYRLNLDVKDSLFNPDVVGDNFSAVLDSLGMTYLNYDYDLRAEIPFEIMIAGLDYEFTVDMGEGLAKLDIDSIVHAIDEGIDVDLKDSRFTLALDNGLPLYLRLRATLLDENEVPLRDSENRIIDIIEEQEVERAVCELNSDGVYTAVAPKRSEFTVALNRDRLDDLSRARKMKVRLGMGTNRQLVDIKRTDKLAIKAFVVLHPAATFDIAVTESGLLSNNSDKD